MFSFIKKRKEILILCLIFVAFLCLHLPGIHIPYHQDEYKWVEYSHPEIIPPGSVPHPPLTELIYTKIGPLVGDDNFRLIPFFFGIFNFFLLFYLVKIIFNKRTAFWAVSLFTISFYSLLASLTVDVDGAVMPFFFLLMCIGYFKWKEKTTEEKNKWKWALLMIIGAVGGFLVKVSALLPIIAIFLDYLIEREVFSDKKKVLKYLLYAFGGAITLVLVLFLAKFIFPFFNLKYSFGYWEHFATSSSFLSRGWFQTFIQFFKSILYTSPLLVIPVFFANKEIFKKTRVFYLFIIFGLIFYLFLFDFSIGALDRYFAFMVIPLCIIVGAIIVEKIKSIKDVKLPFILVATIVILIVNSLQFLSQAVPPLYPKTEWVHRILSLHWNFLYPFSGGSGPLGFYISWMFIGIMWLFGVGLFIWYFLNKERKSTVLAIIMLLGFVYNGVFIQEYLFGSTNGSAPKLVKESVEYIKNNPSVDKVVVYNDNGGWDVRGTGKYVRRLYATPQFEDSYREFFKDYFGYILYIDIPRIGSDTYYSKYFDSCSVVYKDSDKYINAEVLKCSTAGINK